MGWSNLDHLSRHIYNGKGISDTWIDSGSPPLSATFIALML
jgi:hypothetical protein